MVTAAAGSVGSAAGQIAKLRGARVVGIAGGTDKARKLVEHYGFDAGVDYRAADFRDQLKAATPDGVDVLFENVGGDVMEAAIARMNPQGPDRPVGHDLDLQRQGRHPLRLGADHGQAAQGRRAST